MEDFLITVEVSGEFSDDHQRGHRRNPPSSPDSQHLAESAEYQPGSSEHRFAQVLNIAWKPRNQRHDWILWLSLPVFEYHYRHARMGCANALVLDNS
jgi:hypothetical protein